MPWTLYRHILKDLIWLLGVATVVLLVVLSLAVAIKPLSEGLLGPVALARFMLLMMPWLLRIALPFAAAFAATMVFIRMAADNEILGALAGGISYRALLAPVAVLGLVLFLGQAFLAHHTVPRFFRAARMMLETDLVEMLVREVGAGKPVRVSGWVIYADDAAVSDRVPHVPGSHVQPSDLVMLRGMALGRRDRDGRLRHMATCAEADLLLYRSGKRSWVTLQMKDVVRFDEARGELEDIGYLSVPAIRLPSPLDDDPRFMSWRELAALEADPYGFERVWRLRQDLVARMAERRAVARAAGALETGALELVGPDGQAWRVEAPRVEAPGLPKEASRLRLEAAGAAPVRVIYLQDGLATRRAEAEAAELEVDTEQPEAEPRVVLELDSVRVTDLRQGGIGTELTRLRLPSGRFRFEVTGPLAALEPPALKAAAREMTDPAVEGLLAELEARIRKLRGEIRMEVHQRSALALLAFFAMVLGAVFSLERRHSMPLAVFLGVFLLVLAGVLTIFSAENLLKPEVGGERLALWVCWSAAGLLALVAGASYLRLGRGER